MIINYKPVGICPSSIEIDVEDGIIQGVEFTGGCPGNLIGISKLVKGMKISDVIAIFRDVKCGKRPTSCPAELAKALETLV
ncbi:MAG: TIGR03905 family TSCPD domain-containing protein [Oscillospiraceae bacterium]|nr:TIGR03905 family TSCPD domain-containing protein [Oscillospiraceae bacterium]